MASRSAVLWCWFRGKHRGRIGFLHGSGSVGDRVFWLCDSCGQVLRG